MPQAFVEPFTFVRRAPDIRADGASRTVSITAAAVIIERSVAGMRMRIGVPMGAYVGLVVGTRQPVGRATLTLRHEDPDLSIDLGVGETMEVAHSARAWSRLTGRPIAVEQGAITVATAQGRRPRRIGRGPEAALRHPQATRRSRFARRRHTGVPALGATRFAGEREIIARD